MLCVTAPPPRPSGSSADDERPSWMGAPGYTHYADDLPPHAPMPGAPPYPAAEETPPPVGRPAARTRFGVALGAAAVWAAVNLGIVLLVAGAPGSARQLGAFVGALVVPTVLAALIAWLVGRRRAWSFWFLLLVTAPLFWVLRAVFNLPVG